MNEWQNLLASMNNFSVSINSASSFDKMPSNKTRYLTNTILNRIKFCIGGHFACMERIEKNEWICSYLSACSR